MSRPGGVSSRPPFDPRRVPPPEGEDGSLATPATREGPITLTVTQLTRLVKGAINRALPGEIHVVGELSNVSKPSGGHLYFTLKDESSEVRCVMWRSSAQSLKFDLTDGLAVVATGAVDVYEPRGQYQLYVRRLEPRGVGALDLAFRQLKEKLAKEGLFDAARKRKLPRFPERIAVVTSLTGAAVRDILQTIGRRYPLAHVYVFGVRVQGEGAGREIADAIRRINAARRKLGGIDVMIVGRGGGSLEDLWAFNEEIVARAIHASEIPIVSAVGHEVDFTIADFVADVRAATPTAAAEIVVPERMELIAAIEGYSQRLWHAARRTLQALRARLAVVERCEWFRDPVACIQRRQQGVDEVLGRLQLAVTRAMSSRRTALHDWQLRLGRVRPETILARRRERLAKIEHRLAWAQERSGVRAERALRELCARLLAVSPIVTVQRGQDQSDQLAGRLARSMARFLADRERVLAAMEARLAASSHEQVLRRGFSITRKGRAGRVVKTPEDVRTGDRLETQVAGGRIASRVLDAEQRELFD